MAYTQEEKIKVVTEYIEKNTNLVINKNYEVLIEDINFILRNGTQESTNGKQFLVIKYTIKFRNDYKEIVDINGDTSKLYNNSCWADQFLGDISNENTIKKFQTLIKILLEKDFPNQPITEGILNKLSKLIKNVPVIISFKDIDLYHNKNSNKIIIQYKIKDIFPTNFKELKSDTFIAEKEKQYDDDTINALINHSKNQHNISTIQKDSEEIITNFEGDDAILWD